MYNQTCFECPYMGTNMSGQVAICMKSNIGMIDKKQVNMETKPDWCPILDHRTVKSVIRKIEVVMRIHTDSDSKYVAIRCEAWDRIKADLLRE